MPKMTTSEYQEFVSETAIFPDNAGMVYTTLGMIGEAGEVSEKIKKLIRTHRSTRNEVLLEVLTPEQKADLVKEAGDVLWYITAFLAEIGSTLDEAIEINTDKLLSRQQRGVLNGSGDNR
jgi:NTP pyrophosphatase (non-canonical NTP hydrolase)